jgi:hypothetical protein
MSTQHTQTASTMYESDITKFIRELKAAKPHLEEDQRKGRAIWWDKKPLDLSEKAEADAGKVAQKAYPYASE